MRDFFVLSMFSVLVLVPCRGSAAIAVDTNTSGNCNGGPGTFTCSSLTYSITVGAAGTDRLLIVGTVINVSALDADGLTGQTVTSVTYNGQAMTQIGAHLNEDDEDLVDQWYMIAPPTGAHNVVVTASAAVDTILSGATSLTGANQFTPIRHIAVSDSNSTTASTTVSSASGDLVLDTACTGTVFHSSAQTQQYLLNVDGSEACNNIGGSTSAGAANVTMSWSVTHDYWTDFASSVESDQLYIHSSIIGGNSRISGVSSVN